MHQSKEAATATVNYCCCPGKTEHESKKPSVKKLKKSSRSGKSALIDGVESALMMKKIAKRVDGSLPPPAFVHYADQDTTLPPPGGLHSRKVEMSKRKKWSLAMLDQTVANGDVQATVKSSQSQLPLLTVGASLSNNNSAVDDDDEDGDDEYGRRNGIAVAAVRNFEPLSSSSSTDVSTSTSIGTTIRSSLGTHIRDWQDSNGPIRIARSLT